jgi:hypothetical protein
MPVTNKNINYPKCTAKNRSCSIDADYQNGALTVVVSFLPIKDANTSVMGNSDEVTG